MALDLADLARRAAELGGEEAVASVSLRRELLVRCGPGVTLLPPRRTFDLFVRLLVRDGAGRFGVARCSTSTSPDQLVALAEQAHRNAAGSTTDLRPLPIVVGRGASSHGGFHAGTAELDPAQATARAREAAALIGGDPALHRVATWRSEAVSVAVATAGGAVATDLRTGAQLLAQSADVDGRVAASAQASSVCADTLDPADVAWQATPVLPDFARLHDPRVAGPGELIVLLPQALAPVLEALAAMASTGHGVATGLSPFTGRTGMRIAPAAVTVTDDPLHPSTLARSLDVEGVAATAVGLIDRGAVGAVVHDTASADEAGARSTGHAAELGGGTSGALPRNLVMAAGTERHALALSAGAGRCVVISAITTLHTAGPGSTRFTGLARGAHVAQDGEPAHMLGDVVVSGDLLDLVGAIDVLATETELVATLDRLPERTRATTCPAVRTRGLTIYRI